MVEPTLFDEALARTTDPMPSHAAARSVDVSARRQEVIDAMRLLVCASTASEIHEVTQRYGSMQESGSVRSRLNELRRLGLVHKCGYKQAASGRVQTLWTLGP